MADSLYQQLCLASIGYGGTPACRCTQFSTELVIDLACDLACVLARSHCTVSTGIAGIAVSA
eukprot:423646-Pelagomonas_calceolata.AAC.2